MVKCTEISVGLVDTSSPKVDVNTCCMSPKYRNAVHFENNLGEGREGMFKI